MKLANNITNFILSLLFSTNDKIMAILMDYRTNLEGVLQEKLFSKIEKLEALEVVVEKLRKKFVS